MFVVVDRNVGAQDPQERFLDDVVRIGGVPDDTVDVSAKRA